MPEAVLAELRAIAAGLPETYEEQSWAGRRWMVRRRTFAHVLTVDREAGPATILQFRASPDELDALVGAGFPFRKAGWGTDVVNMVVTGAADWDEVRELLTESYCVLAPRKLVARVARPGDGPPRSNN